MESHLRKPFFTLAFRQQAMRWTIVVRTLRKRLLGHLWSHVKDSKSFSFLVEGLRLSSLEEVTGSPNDAMVRRNESSKNTSRRRDGSINSTEACSTEIRIRPAEIERRQCYWR